MGFYPNFDRIYLILFIISYLKNSNLILLKIHLINFIFTFFLDILKETSDVDNQAKLDKYEVFKKKFPNPRT